MGFTVGIDSGNHCNFRYLLFQDGCSVVVVSGAYFDVVSLLINRL